VAATDVFWNDLARDLEDPAFLREYITESMRIATIDSIINALDDARVEAGMSKAELARAIDAEPATVRRLFAANQSNPTLGTIAEVAAALGLRVTVEPLGKSEQTQITKPLLEGRSASTKKLSAHLETLKTASQKRKITSNKSNARQTSTSDRGLRAKYSTPKARISA